MPETSKTFSFETEGLSYTVTVYQTADGTFQADITVDEGAMDVNAIYFGDDDYAGTSASLSGPLNMNGAGSQLDGQEVQWDEAVKLSDPGLGPDGTDKETYVGEGDTLTVQLDIDSLDEIDIFGIRATSTTNEAGSIKGVSDEDDEPEEPEEPIFEKIGFGYAFKEDGVIEDGAYYSPGDLPEGEDATFENYLKLFEEEGGDITGLQRTVFMEMVSDGAGGQYPQEFFRIDAPEGGYESSDQLLEQFDQAVEDGVFDDVETTEDGALDLMAALSIEEPLDEAPEFEEAPVEEEVFDII